MSVLTCSKLDAGYGGVSVVRGFDVDLQPGEMVALLGANGAGKSTVLMTLAGLLIPIAGHIELFGQTLSTRKPYRLPGRGLSFVPDDRALFTTLTVKENLSIAAGKTGKNVAEVLAYFPALQKRLDLAAGMLSGGEQQMLALARALVVSPKVLLVDELSLGLAPVIAQELLSIIRRLADNTGTAVLFVEQHVQMALNVADRGLVMRHGEVELAGTARELLLDRQSLESSYLGSGKAERHGHAVAANGASGASANNPGSQPT
jgi:branched-chain amino acid transport system ATP-binding protein